MKSPTDNCRSYFIEQHCSTLTFFDLIRSIYTPTKSTLLEVILAEVDLIEGTLHGGFCQGGCNGLMWANSLLLDQIQVKVFVNSNILKT